MAKFCSNCGAALEDRAKFCDACGQALEQGEFNPRPEVQQPSYAPTPAGNAEKKKNRLPLILAVAGGAVVIAAAAFLLLRPKNDDTPVAASKPTPTATLASTPTPTPTPVPTPAIAAESVFEIIDGGTFHMDIVFVGGDRAGTGTELFKKDGKLALLMEQSGVSARRLTMDGKFYIVMDEYKTVVIQEADPNETTPMEYGSGELTYVGEGTGDFNGKTYPYSEYTSFKDEKLFYFMDGGALKGIRDITPTGNTVDMEIRAFDTNVSDDIFDLPEDYAVEDETADAEPWMGLWRYEDETGVELIQLGTDGMFTVDSRLEGNILTIEGSYAASEDTLEFTDFTVDGQPGEPTEFALLITGDMMTIDEQDIYIRVPKEDAQAVLDNPLAPYTNPNDTR